MTIHNPLYLQAKGYPSREDRLLIADLVGSEGVLASSDLQPTLTGGLGLSLATGRCYVQGDDQANQGIYRFFSDASFPLSFVAPAGNPRIDLVFARVQDSNEVGSGPDSASFGVISGTPSSGADVTNLNGAPLLTSMLTGMPICYVHVPTSGALVGFKDVRPVCSRTEWKPGDLKCVAYSTPDPGWLVADGTAKSRTTESLLFARIGTTHGAGDGSTTFNIPDGRGRVFVGVDGAAGRLTANDALGNAGGAEKHTLLAAESGVNGSGTTGNDTPDHSHTETSLNLTGGSGIPGGTGWVGTQPQTGGANTRHTHPLSARNADAPHNNMQPFFVGTWMIKT